MVVDMSFTEKAKTGNCKILIITYIFFVDLGKLTIYHSFILSNFNFCPLSWHFCSEANTNKIEKIQEQALRFIYNKNNICIH
jgi:hypothetical protein